jgi:hypothetical protein
VKDMKDMKDMKIYIERILRDTTLWKAVWKAV